jgi:DNA polymerase III sliding clamp (beta) subunit (PCNA family)
VYFLERGEFTSTKVRNTKNVKANVVIFATSNGTERSSKPLLSRFTLFEIPEYTYPEFEAISVRIVKKLPQNTVIQIASSVWKSGSRDIRDVLNIAKLCIEEPKETTDILEALKASLKVKGSNRQQ